MSENKNTEQENKKNQKLVLTARTAGALNALKNAKSIKDTDQYRQTIRYKDREGNDLLIFQVRALTEGEYTEAREKAMDKKNGISKRNLAKERAQLIYMATVDEDKSLWDSREAAYEFDTNNPADIIDEVFNAGEKIAIVNIIDELSGFDEDQSTVDIVDQVKN